MKHFFSLLNNQQDKEFAQPYEKTSAKQEEADASKAMAFSTEADKAVRSNFQKLFGISMSKAIEKADKIPMLLLLVATIGLLQWNDWLASTFTSSRHSSNTTHVTCSDQTNIPHETGRVKEIAFNRGRTRKAEEISDITIKEKDYPPSKWEISTSGEYDVLNMPMYSASSSDELISIHNNDGESGKNRNCNHSVGYNIFVRDSLLNVLGKHNCHSTEGIDQYSSGYETFNNWKLNETGNVIKADSTYSLQIISDVSSVKRPLSSDRGNNPVEVRAGQVNKTKLKLNGIMSKYFAEKVNRSVEEIDSVSVSIDASDISRHKYFITYTTKTYIYKGGRFSLSINGSTCDIKSLIGQCADNNRLIFLSGHGKSDVDTTVYYYRIGSDDTWKSLKSTASTILTAAQSGYLEFSIPKGLKSYPIFVCKY
jgi:hypothetical protein